MHVSFSSTKLCRCCIESVDIQASVSFRAQAASYDDWSNATSTLVDSISLLNEFTSAFDDELELTEDLKLLFRRLFDEEASLKSELDSELEMELELELDLGVELELELEELELDDEIVRLELEELEEQRLSSVVNTL